MDNSDNKDVWAKEKKILVLQFGLFYLFSLFIFSLAWRSATASNEVVNMISIGSGIASISLAIIAIFYSFSQSRSATEHNTLIQMNLHKVSEKVDELAGISTEIAQFRQNFDENMRAVNGLQSELAHGYEKVNESISSINTIVSDLKTPGNEEVIKKLHEEINQLKQATDKQTTKFSKDLAKVASDYVLRNKADRMIKDTVFRNGEDSFVIELVENYAIEHVSDELYRYIPNLFRGMDHLYENKYKVRFSAPNHMTKKIILDQIKRGGSKTFKLLNENDSIVF